ncbi:hypothetical protein LAZ67_X002928 [Cordylochernes scorpioides]|uniref:HTH CENPB-type domain-containing protein n=1 Tax=Cordylochernes scorpioides TaxID=51811 RepID=A0ABY6LU69_9ARAC|nr:hypothetical protein LAZ67_X002928 [Cordylochernes scorpioides]
MGMKKKSDIAKDFGIPRNTLSTYLKNKEKILRSESECDKGRKRLREPGNPDLDKCVLKWFKQARDKKIPVSGHLIRSKAEQFATEMGKTDFKASSGWLDGFKERNKISFKTICGESGAVNLQVAEQWKNNLRELIQDKDARDVFNLLSMKNVTGGKLSKERVTLLVGANMDGSEKLPLLMIGKAANPRCFKNVKTKPVDYANSARAWMTSYLFEKWLLNLDKKFTKEKRKVILFIDNCTAHNSIPPMENVEVIFFPANMTSVIQPMDKGVIKNLKHFYRRFLVENILTGDSEALKIKLDVLQASRLCKKAWDQVTSETIKHCFKKAGFVKKEEDEENADDIIAETMPSVDGWEDVISNPTISYDDFLNVDDDVAVCGEITDADIIAEVLNHNIEKQDGDEASGDKDESSVAGEMNVPSAAEATNYIMQLDAFLKVKMTAVEWLYSGTIAAVLFFARRCEACNCHGNDEPVVVATMIKVGSGVIGITQKDEACQMSPQRWRESKFLKRIQQAGESISEYLGELKHLAINYNFGDMLGTMLRDRFVAGIKLETLQKKLLQEDDDVTLDKVFTVAISFELAEINTRELQDKLVAKISPVNGKYKKGVVNPTPPIEQFLAQRGFWERGDVLQYASLEHLTHALLDSGPEVWLANPSFEYSHSGDIH